MRPYIEGLKDALGWFRDNGYLNDCGYPVRFCATGGLDLILLLFRNGFWLLRERDTATVQSRRAGLPSSR